MNSHRLLAAAAIVSLTFLSCNNASDKQTAKNDSVTTEVTKVDSVSMKASGVYSGYIPCADCAGIMTYLLLSPDMSYRLEETYVGKNDTPVISKGNWKRTDNQIDLYQDNTVKVSFQNDEGKLMQLDAEGKRVSGNLGDRYVLTRNETSNTENAAWNEKKKAGVDFLGVGNEPFWSVEIDKNNSVTFNTPNMKSPVKTPYADPIISNGIRTYHIITDAVKLDITVFPGYCSDGMSDRLYDYKVSLQYNGKKYQGCGVMLNSL